MGRKSSSKARTTSSPPPPETKRLRKPLLIGAAVVAVAAVSSFYLFGSDALSPGAGDAAAATPQSAPAPRAADLKPHPQANLPPLQFPGYPMPRSAEVVTAVYKFAAEHPEVLSYVPCFCGCERSGHRDNEDCFVQTRDVNGDVLAWNDHGMECSVCIDVGQRAMQLHTAGKSVQAIRAAIEKEWGPRSTMHTHTPDPPPGK